MAVQRSLGVTVEDESFKGCVKEGPFAMIPHHMLFYVGLGGRLRPFCLGYHSILPRSAVPGSGPWVRESHKSAYGLRRMLVDEACCAKVIDEMRDCCFASSGERKDSTR